MRNKEKRDRERQEAFHAEQEFQHQRAAVRAAKEREMQHGVELRQQIDGNEQRRTKTKLFEQSDAKFLKKMATKESIIAERVRVETLRKLQRQGVPEEYLRELKGMAINESNA